MKYIDIKEFKDLGLLADINRCYLHPIGMALEAIVENDSYRLTGIQDHRDDPDGVIFDEYPEEHIEKAKIFKKLRHKNRKKSLGFIMQSEDIPNDNTKMINNTVPRKIICKTIGEDKFIEMYKSYKSCRIVSNKIFELTGVILSNVTIGKYLNKFGVNTKDNHGGANHVSVKKIVDEIGEEAFIEIYKYYGNCRKVANHLSTKYNMKIAGNTIYVYLRKYGVL